MSLLAPALMQRLARTKLQPRSAVATGGIGERRSKAKGLGIEFADHRPYQLGDDIRHLDHHVFARLGEHHVRQFSLYQQLPVTILLDASASMAQGEPSKFSMARRIAGALAYVALAGNDRVRTAVFADGQLEWFRLLESARRAPALFDWLLGRRSHGRTLLADVARPVAERLLPGGLLIVISDFMMDDLDRALRVFAQVDQEVVAVHVLSPAEVDPLAMGQGDLTLVDAETGREVDVSIDANSASRYRRALLDWQDELRSLVISHRGRYMPITSDQSLERLLLRDWRVAGLIA